LDRIDTVNSAKAFGMLEGSAEQILDVEQRVSAKLLLLCNLSQNLLAIPRAEIT
jgi:hypothetical protein